MSLINLYSPPFIRTLHPSSPLVACLLLKEPPAIPRRYRSARHNSHRPSISLMTRDLMRRFNTRLQRQASGGEDRRTRQPNLKENRLSPSAICTNCSDSYYKSNQRHFIFLQEDAALTVAALIGSFTSPR